MKKEFCYTFINKSCPLCNIAVVEDFSIDSLETLMAKRSGCYCPKCRIKFQFEVTSDSTFILNARHILQSEEKRFTREVSENELIKKHYVDALWFFVGKKVYIEPAHLHGDEIQHFITRHSTSGNTLVFLPNSHLQRLYFFVPKNALR